MTRRINALTFHSICGRLDKHRVSCHIDLYHGISVQHVFLKEMNKICTVHTFIRTYVCMYMYINVNIQYYGIYIYVKTYTFGCINLFTYISYRLHRKICTKKQYMSIYVYVI